MQSGTLVSSASPDRRLNIDFHWEPGTAGTGRLQVVLPRGVTLSPGSYTLQSSSLRAALCAHFNGDNWTVKPLPEDG